MERQTIAHCQLGVARNRGRGREGGGPLQLPHCTCTERTVRERFLEHKGYVTSKLLSKATGAHFNQQGHSFSDMKVTVLEKIFNKNPQYRKTREKMWINRFNTKYKGLNKISGG